MVRTVCTFWTMVGGGMMSCFKAVYGVLYGLPAPLFTESVVAECAAFCTLPGDEQKLGCLMIPMIPEDPEAMPPPEHDGL